METVHIRRSLETKDFVFWLALAEQLSSSQNQALAPETAQLPLTLFHAQQLQHSGTESGNWYARVCLFYSEVAVWRTIYAQPPFDTEDVYPAQKTHWTVRQLSLADVLQDAGLSKLLRSRLNEIAHYDYAVLPKAVEWYWYSTEGKLLNIAFVADKYVPPEPNAAIEQRDLPFSFHRYAEIYNQQGLVGMMDAKGICLPCRYTYLNSRSFYHGGFIAEVSEKTLKPEGCHRNCDLIDQDGRQLNPPSLQVLCQSGSYGDSIYAVQQKGASAEDLYGYMNQEGNLVGDIAWQAVKKFGVPFGRVQCPKSQLWGYLDRSGELAIDCRFSYAGGFNSDHAFVRAENGLAGIIDKQGRYVIQPEWQDIDSFEEDFWLVENNLDQVGVLDQFGQLRLPFRAKVVELQAGHQFWIRYRIAESQFVGLKDELATIIYLHWSELLQGQTCLSVMQGKLQNGAGKSALQHAGLWGRKVGLLVAMPERGLALGAIGRIGWDYPNTASNYDLSLECPVSGLIPDRQYDVGIAWAHLKLLPNAPFSAFNQ
ncbi:MAG: WG repeat-containing protein [Methylococcaceae bacterium]|nr:WG repeat-containing protein [Methylococcaceae bacterium]